MTGLEKILAQIKADTDRTCADIKNKAEAHCVDIVNSAHAKADKIKEAGTVEARRTKEEIIARANSSADLEKRSVLLSTKQQIISSSLDGAREYICSLPDAEYFSLICKMIAKYSENSDGVIFFSSRDIKRLPKNFEKTVIENARGTLTVSKEPVDIDGGFILKYGGIEVNCAFASIFSAECERFSDTASRLLFA